MRKELIAAASALALMSGAALAQSTAPGAGAGGGAGGTTVEQQPSGGMNQGTAGGGAGSATTGDTVTQTTPGATTGTGTSTDTGAQTTTTTTVIETEPSATSMASAEKMMGQTVVGSDGEEIGEVEDVILDAQSGQAKQLVISSGGFLGIGEKQIAVDMKEAQWNEQEEQVRLSGITQQDVENLPEFEFEEGMTSLTRREGATERPAGAPVVAPAERQ